MAHPGRPGCAPSSAKGLRPPRHRRATAPDPLATSASGSLEGRNRIDGHRPCPTIAGHPCRSSDSFEGARGSVGAASALPTAALGARPSGPFPLKTAITPPVRLRLRLVRSARSSRRHDRGGRGEGYVRGRRRAWARGGSRGAWDRRARYRGGARPRARPGRVAGGIEVAERIARLARRAERDHARALEAAACLSFAKALPRVAPALLAESPVRVVETALERIEVATPIRAPGGTSLARLATDQAMSHLR